MDIRQSVQALAATIFLTVFFSTTTAAPVNGGSCNLACTPDGTLNYEEGNSYTYDFINEVEAGQEGRKVELKGQAVLAAISPCDFELTVKSANIKSSSGVTVPAQGLEGTTLRFAYEKGEIVGVCKADGDPVWSVNVKRGIASMLTDRAVNLNDYEFFEPKEKSVSGICPVSYQRVGETYKKNKDLNKCTGSGRGGHLLSFGTDYDVDLKDFKNPLLDSKQTCSIEVKENRIQVNECLDRYGGIEQVSSTFSTEVKSRIEFVSSSSGVSRSSEGYAPSCIFYDFSEDKSIASEDKLNSVLSDMCKNVEGGVISSDMPSLHFRLMETLRHQEKDAVESNYKKIVDGTLCDGHADRLEYLFLSSCSYSSSDGCFELLTDLVTSGKVTGVLKQEFLIVSSYAITPGEGALRSMKKLIEVDEQRKESILPASGLAHQYCHMTNKNCKSSPDYVALVDSIATYVNPNSQGKEEETILALQALGNLNALTPAAVEKIQTVADSSEPERFQFWALDAFRRDPCSPPLKKLAATVFKDLTRNSNIRIQAYQALTRCLKKDDVGAIQEVVSTEESNQVRSFVVSHVQATRETADPAKRPLKELFENIELPEEFKYDVRKFSRNFQASMFSSEWDYGFGGEGNVIYSHDSYIPRQMSADVSLMFFGKKFDVFEIGGYNQYLEKTVDSVFARFANTNYKEKAKADAGRSKREVGPFSQIDKNELTALKGKVDVTEREGKQPIIDVYFRYLGTTVIWGSANTRDNLKMMNSKKMLEERLQLIEKSHPFILLKHDLVMPTASGLRVKAELQGSFISGLERNMNNKDLNSIFHGKAFTGDFKIVPSISGAVMKKMMVQVGPLQSGVEFEVKAHSSAGFESKIKREGSDIEVMFDLPLNKVQLIDIQSNAYLIEDGVSYYLRTPYQANPSESASTRRSCSGTFADTLGLQTCFDMTVPNSPKSLFDGSARFAVSVEKTEDSMKGYLFQFGRNVDENNMNFKFVLDTPGSSIDRKIMVDGAYNDRKSQTPTINFHLKSPWRKIDVEYALNVQGKKSIEVLIRDDGKEYRGLAQAEVSETGNDSYEVKPLIQYTLPSGDVVKVVEGKINLVNTKPPGKSNIKFDLDKLSIYSKNFGEISFNGKIATSEKSLESDVTASYGKNLDKSFQGILKMSIDGSSGDFDAAIKSTEYEFLNSAFSSHHVFEGSSRKFRGLLTVGPDENPVISILEDIEFKWNNIQSFIFKEDFQLKISKMNVDFKAKTDAAFEPGKQRRASIITSFSDKFSGTLKYVGDPAELGQYEIEGQLKLPEKTYELTRTTEVISKNEMKSVNRLEITPGHWYEHHGSLSFQLGRPFNIQYKSQVRSDRYVHPIDFILDCSLEEDSSNLAMKLDMENDVYFDIKSSHKCDGEKLSAEAFSFVRNFAEEKVSLEWEYVGQGNLQYDLKYIPTGRRILVTSKLERDNDKYDLDASMSWDADNNPDKTATWRSKGIISPDSKKYRSKNNFVFMGKTAEFVYERTLQGEPMKGTYLINLFAKAFSGSEYKLTGSNQIDLLSDEISNKLNIDVELEGFDPLVIEAEGKIKEMAIAQYIVDGESAISLKFGRRTFAGGVNVKSEINSGKRHLILRGNASGSEIVQPIEYSIDLTVGEKDLIIKKSFLLGQEKFNADFSLGLESSGALNTVDTRLAIKTPFESLKKANVHVKVGGYYRSMLDFQAKNEGTLMVNDGDEYEWFEMAGIFDGELKAQGKLSRANSVLGNIVVQGRIHPHRFGAKALVETKDEKAVEFFFDLKHKLPELQGSLKLSVPKYMQPIEMKATSKKTSKYVFEVDFVGRNGPKKARVTSKLDFTPDHSSLDVTVTRSSNAKSNFGISYVKADSTYTVKTNVMVTPERRMALDLTLKKISGKEFDAQVSIDQGIFQGMLPPSMVIGLKKRKNGDDNQITATVEADGKEKGFIQLDYGFSSTATGRACNGKALIKLSKMEWNGEFDINDNRLSAEEDGETGRKVKGHFVLSYSGSPITLDIIAKRSNKEHRLKAELMLDAEEETRSLELLLNHDFKKNHDVDVGLRATFKLHNPEVDIYRGLIISTEVTDHWSQIEHEAKLVSGGESSNPMGYRIYAHPKGNGEYDSALEILLPKRIIASELHSKINNGEVFLEHNLFIDKTKQPDRKVTTTFHDKREDSEDGGYGRSFQLTINHPERTRDIEISASYSIGGSKTLFSIDGVIDVLKEGYEGTLDIKLTKNCEDDGCTLASHGIVKCEAINLNAGTVAEASAKNKEIQLFRKFFFMTADGQMHNLILNADITRSHFHFDAHTDPDTEFLSISTVIERHPSIIELRHQYKLPGMEDTRVIQGHYSALDSPPLPQAQVKVYTTKTDGVLEGFVGLKSIKQFVAGVYYQESNANTPLAELSLALEDEKVAVKNTWESEAILNRFNECEERLFDTWEGFKEQVVSSGISLVSEARKKLKLLVEAAPNNDDVASSLKENLEKLMEEILEDERGAFIVNEAMRAQQMLRSAARIIMSYVHNVVKLVSSAVFTMVHIIETEGPVMVERVLDYIPDYSADLFETGEKIMEKLITFTERMVEILGDSLRIALESVPQLLKYYQKTQECLNNILNTIEEYSKAFMDSVCNAWKSIKKSVTENEWLRSMTEYLMEQAHQLLKALLTQAKESFEDLKTMMSQKFSQEELSKFIELVSQYLEQKAAGVDLNDFEQLKAIFYQFVESVKAIPADFFNLSWQKGYLTAQIPVWARYESFTDLFRKARLPSIPDVQFPTFNFGILKETAYDLVRGVSIRNAVKDFFPPFDSYALIIDSKYFRTFDGVVYEFEGNCQYLLTHSKTYSFGNIDVAIDYSNGGSLTINSDSTTVQLKAKSQNALVNGETVSDDGSGVLWEDGYYGPKSVSVFRMRDWIIFSIGGDQGIGCSMTDNLCGIRISGYSHGNTFGLLGKLNHEEFDDIMTPEGDFLKTGDDIGSAWKLNEQCSQAAPLTVLDTSEEANDECSNYFTEQYSPMRACFGTADHNPYAKICQKMIAAGKSSQESKCTAAAAYQRACMFEHIRIKTFDECKPA